MGRITPLCAASARGDSAAVAKLLAGGADPFFGDSNDMGRSPLIWAAIRGHTDIIKLLLDQGARGGGGEAGEGADAGVQAPLQGSELQGMKEGLSLSMAVYEGVNGADNFGCTSLSMAVYYGHAAVVETLLHHGANPRSEHTDGNSMLVVAVKRAHLEVVKVLLCRGEAVDDPRVADCWGVSPVMWAARNNNVDMLHLLLDHRGQTQAGQTQGPAASDNGYTALGWAATRGSHGTLKALLSRGTDVNERDPMEGKTALERAALIGEVASVTLLLERGAVDVSQGTLVTITGAAKKDQRIAQVVRLLRSHAAWKRRAWLVLLRIRSLSQEQQQERQEAESESAQ